MFVAADTHVPLLDRLPFTIAYPSERETEPMSGGKRKRHKRKLAEQQERPTEKALPPKQSDPTRGAGISGLTVDTGGIPGGIGIAMFGEEGFVDDVQVNVSHGATGIVDHGRKNKITRTDVHVRDPQPPQESKSEEGKED
jgi:hypothetical protein